MVTIKERTSTSDDNIYSGEELIMVAREGMPKGK